MENKVRAYNVDHATSHAGTREAIESLHGITIHHDTMRDTYTVTHCHGGGHDNLWEVCGECQTIGFVTYNPVTWYDYPRTSDFREANEVVHYAGTFGAFHGSRENAVRIGDYYTPLMAALHVMIAAEAEYIDGNTAAQQ